eukprot:2916254-Prymnesium_polylepis.1
MIGDTIALVVDLAQRLIDACTRRIFDCTAAGRCSTKHWQQHPNAHHVHSWRRRFRRLTVICRRKRKRVAVWLPPVGPDACNIAALCLRCSVAGRTRGPQSHGLESFRRIRVI